MSENQTFELYCPECGRTWKVSADPPIPREQLVETYKSRQQGDDAWPCLACKATGKTISLEVH